MYFFLRAQWCEKNYYWRKNVCCKSTLWTAGKRGVTLDMMIPKTANCWVLFRRTPVLPDAAAGVSSSRKSPWLKKVFRITGNAKHTVMIVNLFRAASQCVVAAMVKMAQVPDWSKNPHCLRNRSAAKRWCNQEKIGPALWTENYALQYH